MDDKNITMHVKNFNDRVRAMNQTHSKDLTMSAADARNLQADIFNLLSLVAELSAKGDSTQYVQIAMDGGGFK